MTILTRRQMLAGTTATLTGLALNPLSVLAEADKKADYYTLPKLPYAYTALEPHIDAETMKIHHDKHHLAYITGAKAALKDYPKLLAKPVEDLLADMKDVPEKIKKPVTNMVGGHSNHTIFWEIMGPKAGGEPKGALGKAITKTFKSFDAFQKEFSLKALTQFGSGWAWLVYNPKKKELEIVQRANQDSPIMDGLKPLVGIDVWEHAYYLKYKNLRASYIAAWWKVVNWKAVAERANKAMKG